MALGQAAFSANIVHFPFFARPGLHAQVPGNGIPDVRARELTSSLRRLVEKKTVVTIVVADSFMRPLFAPLGFHARGAGRHHDVRAEEPTSRSRAPSFSCSSLPFVSVSLLRCSPSTKSTIRRGCSCRREALAPPRIHARSHSCDPDVRAGELAHGFIDLLSSLLARVGT